jgi:streptogramin lyase
VNSGPYGIAVVKDVLWYSESGVSPNTLVRFDPKTEKFQTWEIPSGGGVVRNMMATQDGNLVLVDRLPRLTAARTRLASAVQTKGLGSERAAYSTHCAARRWSAPISI